MHAQGLDHSVPGSSVVFFSKAMSRPRPLAGQCRCPYCRALTDAMPAERPQKPCRRRGGRKLAEPQDIVLNDLARIAAPISGVGLFGSIT